MLEGGGSRDETNENHAKETRETRTQTPIQKVHVERKETRDDERKKKKKNVEERLAHVVFQKGFRNARETCEETACLASTAERRENDESSKDVDESRKRRKIRSTKRHEKHVETHTCASKHVTRTCRNEAATHPRICLPWNDVACVETAEMGRGERQGHGNVINASVTKKLTRKFVLHPEKVGRTANQGHVIFLKLFSSDLVIPVFVGKDANDS